MIKSTIARANGRTIPKRRRTISEHLKNIYVEGELSPEATIRKFRIVRLEVEREVAAKQLPLLQKKKTDA